MCYTVGTTKEEREVHTMAYYYNYLDELAQETKRERARMRKTGELSVQGWRLNNSGSRGASEGSMSSILAAYADAQATDSCWY